ncbi:MAG: hypothetical protein U9P44_02210 [archaeon]|nr:hypothetical protein [archaeon]
MKEIQKKEDEKDKETKKTKEDTGKEKTEKNMTGTIIITLFIIILLGTCGIMLKEYNKNRAIEQCLLIQNHPDLNYPCKCYPSEKPKDMDPYVDEKTEKYCRCKCDIGNNQTYTVYIVRAI